MSIARIKNKWLRRAVLVSALPALIILYIATCTLAAWADLVCDVVGATRGAWRGQ